MTPNFEKCTEVATELLLNQNLADRVLNVRHMNFGDKNVMFETIQNYSRIINTSLTAYIELKTGLLRDGCLLILDNDTYLVLYNDKIKDFHHLNWTLAHEVGHIYMGHIKDGPIEEIEAHFFAAQLFMPEYSIWKIKQTYGSVSKTDITEIFCVSQQAAEKRIETLNNRTQISAGRNHQIIWEAQKQRVTLYFNDCGKDSEFYRMLLSYNLLYGESYEQYYNHDYYVRTSASGGYIIE